MTSLDERKLTSEELVRSWGLEAPPIPDPRDVFISEPYDPPGRSARYCLAIGAGLGGLIGFATFVGLYIYCIAAYGFILGFGLGWLRSGFAALIVSQVVRFLWGPIILLVALVVVYATNSSIQCRRASSNFSPNRL